MKARGMTFQNNYSFIYNYQIIILIICDGVTLSFCPFMPCAGAAARGRWAARATLRAHHKAGGEQWIQTVDLWARKRREEIRLFGWGYPIPICTYIQCTLPINTFKKSIYFPKGTSWVVWIIQWKSHIPVTSTWSNFERIATQVTRMFSKCAHSTP